MNNPSTTPAQVSPEIRLAVVFLKNVNGKEIDVSTSTTTFAIPGLPDGWEAVAYRPPLPGEWTVVKSRANPYLWPGGSDIPRLIVSRVESVEKPIHPAASCAAAACRAMEIANERSTKQPMLTQEMVDRAQEMERAEDEPVCTWPRGVFKDGWLAEDESGMIFWYSTEPLFSPIPEGKSMWSLNGQDGIHKHINNYAPEDCYLPLKITFRQDLPWNKRIVKVGPEAERGMM